MPYIDIATDARLEYIDAGDGEPLIAIHGLLGTARKHLGRVIDWLAGDFRVLGPSMRGYGQSRPKPRRFPPDFYQQDSRDVLAFLDALAIEEAHILGYSDGGEIALMCGGMAPDRFLSVTAWGAVGYFGPILRDVVSAPGYLERLAPTPTEMTQHGIMDREEFAQAWIDAVLHMVNAGGDVSLSTANRITAPLLIMLGHDDTLNPAAYARRYIEKAGHGRLEMFECGHPVHDQQWEAFQRVLGEFLAEARRK